MKARSALPFSDGAAGPVLRAVPDAPPCSADPELFFSEIPAEIETAKGLCAGCPLRASCLADALERREGAGVWGGELFANGRPVKPPKPQRSRARKMTPGDGLGNGRAVGAVSLWCDNKHRRSVANTGAGADGKVICLDCARKRSRKSRARKRQRHIPGTVSLWCSNGHRRSTANTRERSDGYAYCLDCASDRRAKRPRKAVSLYRNLPGSVSLWCSKGHRRGTANTRITASGQTLCKDCDRLALAARRAAKRLADRADLELAA